MGRSDDGTLGRVVDIAPPRWFALLARAMAVVSALLGLGGGGALVAQGAIGPGSATVLCGAVLAAMTWDVAQRRVVASGDSLVVRQWYRTRTVDRSDIEQFVAVRGSFVRWDIVAERHAAVQLRLWVTRMLPAGRRSRLAWLDDLERWRTARAT